MPQTAQERCPAFSNASNASVDANQLSKLCPSEQVSEYRIISVVVLSLKGRVQWAESAGHARYPAVIRVIMCRVAKEYPATPKPAITASALWLT